MRLMLLFYACSTHAFSTAGVARIHGVARCSSTAVSMKIPDASISDFMTPIVEAVVLDPEMNLREAANLLQEKQITGAPVVSDQKLVGVLSQFDFLFKAAGTNALDLEADSYRTDVKKILGGTVRNVMTTDPVTFSPADPVRARHTPTHSLPNDCAPRHGVPTLLQVSAVASVMIKRRFNHVPIVEPDDGAVVGIIRSTDVMRYVLAKS